MAECSSFFNSYKSDRRYTAAQFAEYFASFIGNGVFWGGSAVKVEADGSMNIKVLEGKGWINGYYYKNIDAPKTLTLEGADFYHPRIDRVVLRLDLSQVGRWIQAVIKTGEPAATPSPPALQRDNAAWELGLADIRVNANVKEVFQSNITDLRLNADMCGVVAAVIDQPDLTLLFNQYQSYLSLKTEEWNTEQDRFFTMIQTWYDDFTRDLLSVRGAFVAQFEAYLDEKMASWETTRQQQQLEYETQKNTIAGWYAAVRNDIAKLQVFDFDYLHALVDAERITTFDGGNATEVIVGVYDQIPVAKRLTVFEIDGGITETVTVYAEGGVSVMRKTVKVTVFHSDGRITETVTGIVFSDKGE